MLGYCWTRKVIYLLHFGSAFANNACQRFSGLGPAFYRGSDACILVFDVHNASSFKNLAGWKDEFLSYSKVKEPNSFPFVVVGNKIDLEGERAVSAKQIETWCKSVQRGHVKSFEASAKAGTGVSDAFHTAAKQALFRQQSGQEEMTDILDGIKLSSVETDKDEGCGC
eukprot:TRINITY_DN8898_c0_g1_i1.p1 TRINITY_DN8898_c0_g1~~TRINITY_DN8898_c0_g1_i1.p1  ORF type:complete len:168 (+),score=23.89 TRINITY_DN8898_c0_g1_i1:180-683(+)